MAVLIQISDTHFGTEQPPVVEALLSLVRRLKPAVAVLSGDITQRARRSQFAAARRFVDRLGIRNVLCVPGNHDIPLFNLAARALSPYGNYGRVFGAELEPHFDCDAFMIACVNTTRPARHKDGEVSQQQIDRVASRLRGARHSQVRIVVTHQPVCVVRASDVENRLHGHEQAVHAWSDAGADIIMGGHIHLPYMSLLSERFMGLRRRCWAVQAGTAISWRIRERIPNSVNVVVYAPGDRSCRVERWDYDPAAGRFHRVDAANLDLDRS